MSSNPCYLRDSIAKLRNKAALDTCCLTRHILTYTGYPYYCPNVYSPADKPVGLSSCCCSCLVDKCRFYLFPQFRLSTCFSRHTTGHGFDVSVYHFLNFFPKNIPSPTFLPFRKILLTPFFFHRDMHAVDCTQSHLILNCGLQTHHSSNNDINLMGFPNSSLQ